MVEQTFVGNKPVDQLPSEAAQKIPDEHLDKLEASRNASEQPGANKRAGIASRDPADVDTKDFGGSRTNPQPQYDPVI
ncbi:hypothetical protein PsYK624_142930 [Phanerochaete sordida]|uniref:Uncharacterized protein n=1 Tax=Phanerochaete sordida TaxID=48140 RepID=A0A9P3GNQ9_9APHY|nr:hypothetical protein PsYK624_142930 [Phanerochaete sordida]